MLFKYKTDYEKIAMGLLSFIPDLDEVSHLKEELTWYQTEASRQLYLWKNASGDFAGVIGIELNKDYVIIRHLALSPSDRNEGNSFAMLTELAELYPDNKLMGTISTSPLIAKWEQTH
ncbi:RibT protein [Loigolactobacillus backii]|uniref:RibT protein n=1 Tax=Loigolactobacillus backii TaxID=375175 RepID=A0A192H4F3_9LACO|nr:RibT protein [Loigolactobacillus backii]ANK59578.1 RibT protein [Loigolactobacillus backii]ANK62856.1 RibT protein [Loigolactobacillus backii]ANK64572.1 RibT protein [Loigolactobacillus backii]ANK67033.1 RibT protein [Loigolactobacillus backii]ANK70136.1 RibT protein [Loigolactobacillus backii]